jgi:hypothetical protein
MADKDTTVGMTTDTRNRLAQLRDAKGYSTYEDLLRAELLENE